MTPPPVAMLIAGHHRPLLRADDGATLPTEPRRRPRADQGLRRARPHLAMDGGVIKCPPPSARAQSQLRPCISLSTCRWKWARNNSTAHGWPHFRFVWPLIHTFYNIFANIFGGLAPVFLERRCDGTLGLRRPVRRDCHHRLRRCARTMRLVFFGSRFGSLN